ncbi:hypothetical protein EV182_004400, partial [Spiromyces aspiralis]
MSSGLYMLFVHTLFLLGSSSVLAQDTIASSSSSSTASTSTASEATSQIPTPSPNMDDTFFSGWVTPGLISGLIATTLFFALVSVGISWITSIQGPTRMPTQQDKKKN